VVLEKEQAMTWQAIQSLTLFPETPQITAPRLCLYWSANLRVSIKMEGG
jgi:hypothetical protein